MSVEKHQPHPRLPGAARLLALGAAILLCGVIIGAGLGSRILWSRAMSGARDPARLHARVTERLARRLDLTAEQERQVRQILRDHREQQALILERVQPELEAEVERMRGDVARLLTPEQAERWNRRFEDFRRRWAPLRRGGPRTGVVEGPESRGEAPATDDGE